MKKQYLLFILIFVQLFSFSQNQNNTEINLLIRGDDIGSSHAANVGCIESYKNGIMRSVELMPVCAWFPEAVKMLNQNKDLDVGVHLALTSEWSNIKWRPLTNCPSLVDSDGYFFPMVWKNENFPSGSSLTEANWNINEIENELRAQINLALKHVPHISHMGGHMGFSMLDPKIAELMDKLSVEYDLKVDLSKSNIKRFSGWSGTDSYEKRIYVFCENLRKLTPGNYIFVEHPAKDTPEMQQIKHTGYENVALDREWVTRVFTSEKVKNTITELGINLISYKDLK